MESCVTPAWNAGFSARPPARDHSLAIQELHFVTDQLIALPPQANQTNGGHPHGRVPRIAGGLGVQSLLSRVVSLSRQTLVCALLPYLGPCSRSSWPLSRLGKPFHGHPGSTGQRDSQKRIGRSTLTD